LAEVKGGDKLERVLRELSRKVSDGATLRAGFLAGATYPNGTPVATVAAVHNWGAPAKGIPPRPFFSNVVKAGQKTWGGILANLLKTNQMDARKALQLMGEGIKGQIQTEIGSGKFVPLKPATVRRKGFAQTLIDTGHMQNSVDFEVK
jgi:hypothetical protein